MPFLFCSIVFVSVTFSHLNSLLSPLLMYFSVGVTTGWDFVIEAIASVQLVGKLGATLCSDGSCKTSSGMTAGATFGYCKPRTNPLMRYGADVAASF